MCWEQFDQFKERPDYLGRDLHNGQPATERAVGCVGKVAAMQRRRRGRNGRERGVGGRKKGLNCAALVPPFPLTLTSLPNLPTNREPPSCLCHAYCTQTQMHIAHKHITQQNSTNKHTHEVSCILHTNILHKNCVMHIAHKHNKTVYTNITKTHFRDTLTHT